MAPYRYESTSGPQPPPPLIGGSRAFSRSGGGGGAHHDPRLGGSGAGFAADRADRLVELVGVAAGEPQMEVEAAGEEVDLPHGGEAERLPLELVGVGAGQQADV